MNGSQSRSAMGERGSIASPPDNSVSSTSCSDDMLKQNLLMSDAAVTFEDASSEDAIHGMSFNNVVGKTPCDMEESEVTSSSEILQSSILNASFPSDALSDIVSSVN